jgi:hypothetical protein
LEHVRKPSGILLKRSRIYPDYSELSGASNPLVLV